VENEEAEAAREALQMQQYMLGLMEEGFQEGYKMGLQDGWNKGFDDGLQEGYQETAKHSDRREG
jgi:flagellar biosynthesis/type III secretory pathway protein FliH